MSQWGMKGEESNGKSDTVSYLTMIMLESKTDLFAHEAEQPTF